MTRDVGGSATAVPASGEGARSRAASAAPSTEEAPGSQALTGSVVCDGHSAVLRWVRRDPPCLGLEPLAHVEKLYQVDAVSVALVLAELVIVAHLDGVEVADIHTYTAQDAPAEIDLEGINDLSSSARRFGVLGIVHHLRAHALRGAGTYADHTSRAVRLRNVVVPQQRGKAHVARRDLAPLLRIRVLVCYRLAQRRLERYLQPFQKTYHSILSTALPLSARQSLSSA